MDIEIKDTKSKGRGVFAASDIKAGEQHASEGIRIHRLEIQHNSVLCLYLFKCKKEDPFHAIFLSDWGNFINCDRINPNLTYEVADDNRTIIFTANRDIAKGEELTIDYGYDVETYASKLGIDVDKYNEETGSTIKLISKDN